MKMGKGINVNEIVQSIENAPLDQKSEAIVKAIQAAVDAQKAEIVSEYQEMHYEVQANKESAEKFGLRTLNQKEKDFYQAIAEGTFEGNKNEDLIPETVLNFIFDDLKRSRPLFKHINWSPAGLKKWLIGDVAGEAVWGAIDAKITEEIKANLDSLNLDAFKLSAFAVVPNGIIKLGHQWIDKYVREALVEANAKGLEKSFVTGDGTVGPLGLDRQLKAFEDDGKNKKRTAVKIDAFTPLGLSEVLAGLTNDGKRAVNKVILIVNPLDEFTLVNPATKFLTSSGEYRTVFPIATEVISVEEGLERGKAIMYLPGTYQAGISQMGIDTSDHHKFLDDARTYKIVSYGNGRLKEDYMAAYLDISEVKPLAFNVQMDKEDTTPGA